MSEWDEFKTRIRNAVSKKLAGFSATIPPGQSLDDLNGARPDASAFPVPELVLFLMRDIMGWTTYGHGEKVRWSVFGSVDGKPVAFELRKMGFTICLSKSGNIKLSRIEGQLSSAIRALEPFLQPLADHQVASGAVLIVNRDAEFRSRYQFFRSEAKAAFLKARRKPRRKKEASGIEGIPQMLTADLNHVVRHQHIGFFNSTAMVDSYFSALEHRLVLLRAFSGAPLTEGGLVSILASRWDDKLTAILPSPLSREAGLLLGTLRRIKERIRNPFAHGGVENDGGSLFLHMPNVGAIPANFTRFGDSVRFSFIPVDADDHSECCKAFDALDTLLSTGALASPYRLMTAGIDPNFDAKSLKEYHRVVKATVATLDRFIDRWGHDWERHANKDY
jgi:hypothetical protein